MCLLIVLRGFDADYPVLVASNRDEMRARRASPPGLFVGERRRILSPRDRLAGGTWLGVNDFGLVAGLTNVAGAPDHLDVRSRGHLPHLALDQDDVAAAVEAVRAEVGKNAYNAFQLVIASATATMALLYRDGKLEAQSPVESLVVVSNEHRPGELELPLGPAVASGGGLERRLAALGDLLLDQGERTGHRILKKGGDYGTVSSSLIAVHRDDPRQLVWRYAPGPPDGTAYRNYGNLGRRLVES